LSEIPLHQQIKDNMTNVIFVGLLCNVLLFEMAGAFELVRLQKRIINGDPQPRQLSWIASIQNVNGGARNHHCAGSMVAKNVLLTGMF
jgi:hypothetical protein